MFLSVSDPVSSLLTHLFSTGPRGKEIPCLQCFVCEHACSWRCMQHLLSGETLTLRYKKQQIITPCASLQPFHHFCFPRYSSFPRWRSIVASCSISLAARLLTAYPKFRPLKLKLKSRLCPASLSTLYAHLC